MSIYCNTLGAIYQYGKIQYRPSSIPHTVTDTACTHLTSKYPRQSQQNKYLKTTQLSIHQSSRSSPPKGLTYNKYFHIGYEEFALCNNGANNQHWETEDISVCGRGDSLYLCRSR